MATEVSSPYSNDTSKVDPQRNHFGIPPAHIYDTICVGFSTVGLGLAVALSDLTLDSLSNVVFLERSPSFSSKLGSGSQYMRTSFAQDLATMRCPTSPYTFLNYLSEKKELKSFMGGSVSINPTREVFEEYLHWAAAKFHDAVMYEEEALSVELVVLKDEGTFWVVTKHNTRTGDVGSLLSKNVVFAREREARLARSGGKLEVLRAAESSELLSSNGKRATECGILREEDVLPNLAVKCSKIANILIFESQGKVKRAIL